MIGNHRRESGLFYFVFDPDVVKAWYLKTALNQTDDDWKNGKRCSYLDNYPDKYHFEECCITDLPEGLRDADIPKG